MTALTGYIQGLGNGEKRTVDKTGKEIKLSVYDNIDRVIVFNEAGETSQVTNDGRNLYNKDDSSLILTGYLTSEGLFANGGTGVKTICLSVDASTTYTVSKIQSARFRIGTYSAIPSYNDTINNLVMNDNATSLTVTTGASDSYLLAFIYNSSSDTLTLDEILDTVQIEKGSQPTSYEPYCGGVPSPNPSYPQDVKGIGTKRLDGTYSVRIDYDDGDEHFGSITASGLAYPLYEGDILDFVNGKVIRANGIVDLGTLNWNYQSVQFRFYSILSDTADFPTNSNIQANILCNKYLPTTYSNITLTNYDYNNHIAGIQTTDSFISIKDSNYTDPILFKTAMEGTYIVYPLATPTDEYITLSGDISDIGTATVTADGTLTVKYDKVEMAIRKYSAKPDWSVIGYSDTPFEILSAFDYAKNLQRTWSFQKQSNNTDVRIFPDVDLTGYRDYSYMFANCTYLMSLPDLVIGEETPTGDIACNNFLYKTGVENLKLSTKTSSQKVYLNDGFCENTNLKTVELNMKASSCQYMFGENRKLTRVTGTFDTSEVENFNYVFYNALSLTTVPEWDTSSGLYFSRAFRSCIGLEYAPVWNLSSAVDLSQMFWEAYNLKHIPFYRIPSATNISGMYAGTGNSLTENSRNNILLMCMSATSYTGTKTLAELGFTSSMYSAASWQSLTDYNNFVSAGWSIGYS